MMRRALAGLWLFLAMQWAVQSAWAVGAVDKTQPQTNAVAADNRLITLSSGERHGMYYWFATVLGGVISQPKGALPCTADKGCGVADSILVNLASEGSLDNLERLRSGQTHTGFAQSNLAYAAYSGQGGFEGRGNDKLRAIASFYPEVLHVLVAADSGIEKIEDLAGKRIVIGAPQSGTQGSAQALLSAYGVEHQAESLGLEATLQRFLAGESDAVFFFSAAGNPLVKRIADEKNIRLLPVRSDIAKQLVRENSYYQTYAIPAGTYDGQDEDISGIAVQALWLASEDLDEALVYALTKAVWEGEGNIAWLQEAMPKGAWEIDNALKGIGIPLHPGAKKYYNEIGKRY